MDLPHEPARVQKMQRSSNAEREMIRIREILDPDLRRRIVEALANRRGCSVASIPAWFELDDADYVDLLNDLKEDTDQFERPEDPRV
jgi:hypothetical protein